MRGYIPEKELREVMHESGRVPALIRAINNAIPKGGAEGENQLLERNWKRRRAPHPLGNGRRIIISSPTQPLDVVDAGAFSLQGISNN